MTLKALFLSLIITVICFAGIRPAHAERTYDKRTDVVRIVVKTKAGYLLLDKTFDKPSTTLVKTCDHDARRECVYEVKRGKEVYIYDYEAAELTYPRYTTQIQVADAR